MLMKYTLAITLRDIAYFKLHSQTDSILIKLLEDLYPVPDREVTSA